MFTRFQLVSFRRSETALKFVPQTALGDHSRWVNVSLTVGLVLQFLHYHLTNAFVATSSSSSSFLRLSWHNEMLILRVFESSRLGWNIVSFVTNRFSDTYSPFIISSHVLTVIQSLWIFLYFCFLFNILPRENYKIYEQLFFTKNFFLLK